MPYCGGGNYQISITPNKMPNQKDKNPLYVVYKGFCVASEGIEPSSQVPETYVLSIVLRSHYFYKITKTYLTA
jgi:hypothetical protein